MKIKRNKKARGKGEEDAIEFFDSEDVRAGDGEETEEEIYA